MSSLIIRGNIMPMTGEGVRAEAVGFVGGFIKVVGSLEAVRRDMPAGTEVEDFGSALVVPGLVDTHIHPLTTGISMVGIDMSETRSITEVLRGIRSRAVETQLGEWIIGTRFQDKLTEEGRFPSLEELDAVTTDHPVMVQHNDIHYLQLNTAGLHRLLGKVSGTNGIAGYFEDPEALDIIETFQKDLPEDKKIEYMRNVCEIASRRGLTGLHVKEVWKNLEPLLEVEDTLPVRLKPMVFATGPDDGSIDVVLAHPGLRRRAVLCLINDGTLDGHTAALLEPYTDRPDLRGSILFSDGELERFFRRAFCAGVQASIHAVGDATIEQILRVAEGVLDDYPLYDHRLRIEHFEMPAQGQIQRAAKLGITVGVQPMLIPVCQGMDFKGYRPFVGERVYRANTFKSYLDAGMLIAGGSDSPVTPMDPFQGIAAAINHPIEAERLSFEEALSLYTVHAAGIAFEEAFAGTLSPGKRADFTVIDYDPVSDDPLPSADSVQAVFIGGVCVYGGD